MYNLEEVGFLALGMSQDGNVPVLLLGNKNKSRALPLMIGETEAINISMALVNNSPHVPDVHSLFNNLIAALELKIDRIIIKGNGDTCSAVIEIESPYQNLYPVQVEARTTDAITIALRSRIPIHVTESLFYEHSVQYQSDKDGFVLDTTRKEEDSDESFREFLKNVNPSDFEKYSRGK